MKNLDGTVSEAMMTAVILLELYENISSDVVEFDSALCHHIQGLSGLANLNGAHLAIGNGPSLLEMVCCQMVRPLSFN